MFINFHIKCHQFLGMIEELSNESTPRATSAGAPGDLRKSDVFTRLSLSPQSRTAKDSIFSFLDVRIKPSLGGGKASQSSMLLSAASLEKVILGAEKKKTTPALSAKSRLNHETAAQRHSRFALEKRKEEKEAAQKRAEDERRKARAPIRKVGQVPISESLIKPNQSQICAMQELEERRASPNSKIVHRRKFGDCEGTVELLDSAERDGSNNSRNTSINRNGSCKSTSGKSIKVSERLMQRTKGHDLSIQAFIKQKGEVTDESDPWWELRSSKLSNVMNMEVPGVKTLKNNARGRLYSHTEVSKQNIYQPPAKAIIVKPPPKVIEGTNNLLTHTKQSTQFFAKEEGKGGSAAAHIGDGSPILKPTKSKSKSIEVTPGDETRDTSVSPLSHVPQSPASLLGSPASSSGATQLTSKASSLVMSQSVSCAEEVKQKEQEQMSSSPGDAEVDVEALDAEIAALEAVLDKEQGDASILDTY